MRETSDLELHCSSSIRQVLSDDVTFLPPYGSICLALVSTVNNSHLFNSFLNMLILDYYTISQFLDKMEKNPVKM